MRRDDFAWNPAQGRILNLKTMREVVKTMDRTMRFVGRTAVVLALILASIGIGVLIFLIGRTSVKEPYAGSIMVYQQEAINNGKTEPTSFGR